jgi:hypothetical protein
MAGCCHYFLFANSLFACWLLGLLLSCDAISAGSYVAVAVVIADFVGLCYAGLLYLWGFVSRP